MTSKTRPHKLLVLLRRLCDRPGHVSDEAVLGQCERAALAAALKLRSELGGRVTALAVGPAARENRVLAMALRAGCDAAVRVYDAKLDGLDYLGTAKVLAAAAKHLGFDAILCGDRSEDELQSATGPAVAELVGVTHLSNLVDVRGDEGAVVARHRAGGSFHKFRCQLPAVLCITAFPRSRHPHDGDARTPNGTAHTGESTLSVRTGTIDDLNLDDLDVDPRELSHRREFLGRARPARPGCNATMVATPRELVERMIADRLLG